MRKLFPASRWMFFLAMSGILVNCTLSGNNKNEISKAGADTMAITAINSKTEFAEAGGKKTAFRSIGNGKPIIMCTRFRATLDDWDPSFLDELARNFRVITFDYSGIGRSAGELANEFTAVGEDVKALTSFLKIDKFIMAGWSWGGMLAQTFAVQNPDRVTHLVLMGTFPPGKNDTPIETLFLETASKPVNDFADEIILFFEPASEYSRKAAKETHDRIALRIHDRDLPYPQKFWKTNYEALSTYFKDSLDIRTRLGKIPIPILNLSGDHDIAAPVENWFALNRKWPNLQTIVVPQAGHGPHHQNPVLNSRYITNFVQHATVR